jgi:4-diphosphocytidyl-2-C-methyl-D-erythritol kinase
MKVEVDKKIPPGGGLGGGSANAAAILRWANFKDEKKAVHLGSDVPFNIRGGRASVSGVGEFVTYLPYEEKTFTLILPPFGCSTADVYKRWDEMGGPQSPNGNDLEPAALDVYPELQKWKEILEGHAKKEARLAGSGSTWFVEGSYPAEGLIVATTTRENF